MSATGFQELEQAPPRMSSRLEGRFWEMAYTLDQWPDLG